MSEFERVYRLQANGQWGWETVVADGGGGGSQPSTATATMTANRAGGFIAEHVFDLGSDGPHPLQATFTVTVANGDGETWGLSPGEIQITTGTEVSLDNITYKPGGTFTFTGSLVDVGDAETMLDVPPRYMKATMEIDDSDFAVYGGSNDPVASVRADLIYT